MNRYKRNWTLLQWQALTLIMFKSLKINKSSDLWNNNFLRLRSVSNKRTPYWEMPWIKLMRVKSKASKLCSKSRPVSTEKWSNCKNKLDDLTSKTKAWKPKLLSTKLHNKWLCFQQKITNSNKESALCNHKSRKNKRQTQKCRCRSDNNSIYQREGSMRSVNKWGRQRAML